MVAPLVAAAGISALGSVIGGLFGSSGAKKAANIQAQSARDQIAAAERNRDYQYSLNAPTIDAGNRAIELYSGFLGAGTPDYGAYVRSDPGLMAEYQRLVGTGEFSNIDDYGRAHYEKFGKGEGRDLSAFTGDGGASDAIAAYRGSTGYADLVKEGLGAVNANAYASGKANSGATLKALQNRGMSLADRSSQTWMGNLGNLINSGSNARGLVAGVGSGTVGAINNATAGAADASSNASLVNSSNWANVLKDIGLSASTAYGSSYGSSAGLPGTVTGYGGGTWNPGQLPGTIPQFGFRNIV